MKLWLTLLIPIIFTVLFYSIESLRSKLTFWEIPLMFFISIGIIGIIKYSAEYINTQDTERVLNYISYTEHHEYWNEWIDETYETYTTDSDGKEICTEYDCSYREEYDPFTICISSDGTRYKYDEGYNIDYNLFTTNKTENIPTKFNQLSKKFGTHKIFVEDHKKNLDKNYGDKFDGSVYRTYWNGEIERLEYTHSDKSYTNRTLILHSLENYEPVDSSEKRESMEFLII